MIKSIHIKNFILIDELNLNLEKGFTVITGETGAGKSILLNSINIALGGKGTKEIIKTGKTVCSIEITFKIDNNNLNLIKILNENGLDITDKELIISKEVSQTSSRSRINGILVTQDFIKDIREFLIDIHTQHQSYTYIQPKYHIDLLDKYGDNEHKNLLKTFENLYFKYSETKKELEKVKTLNEKTLSQIDFLKFQINEIEDANIIDTDEDKKLDEELQVLSNAGDIKKTASSIYYSLSEDENAVLSQINYIKSNISKYSNIDKNFEEYNSDLEASIDILRDLASKIRNYSEYLEVDEQKIFDIQNRIEVLENIKRKYGRTLENVVENYKNFIDELNNIENGVQNQEELEKKEKEYSFELKTLGKKISENRQILSEKLSIILTKELEKLELPKVKFQIENTPCELTQKGFDKIEFLISTNISEGLKPLIKVASGGEISRVMLALKTVFALSDNVETVIFDEIDTGISGVASQSVADEIKELSKTHQVIAITHQPIIAAKGDNHLFVMKKQEDKTDINVYILSEEEKLHAIAMLASGNDNEKSMEFAKQLVGYKKKINDKIKKLGAKK